MSAICRLVFLYTLHCVAALIGMWAYVCDILFYFLNVALIFAHFPKCEVCYESALQVWNGHAPGRWCRLITYETLVALCNFVFFVCCCICAFLFLDSLCVCACVCPLRAWFVFPKFVCASLCVSLCMCVYNPRPFNSTTWIHPISWSPWLPGPLITEGPGRSNRCASWRCLSSTTVARNLCCTQRTGACRRQWKPAGVQKHCLDVPVWTGVCVRVCSCI